MNRRRFLAQAGLLVVSSLSAKHRSLGAQSAGQSSPTGVLDMDGDWYHPVRLPPKAGTQRRVTASELDDFERQLACPCPCTHDVLTCRTVDATCVYAPAIHRDLLALAQGGYSSDEMQAAMRSTYGDGILMLPSVRGLSVLAWLAPIAATTAAGYALVQAVRTWQRPSRNDGDISEPSASQRSVAPSSAELARVTQDVRNLHS